MKILQFPIQILAIETGISEIADKAKILIYQEDESLIDKIGFDNDKAFLEPSLFYYLRKRAFNELPKINISQIISGYCLENIEKLDVFADENGVCYLPNLGYAILDNTVNHYSNVRLNLKNRTLENGKLNPLNAPIPIQQGTFYACYHQPEIFEEMGVELNENMFSSTSKMLPFCNEALNIIQKFIPDYYELIKLTTREFVLFNSSNTESFAALHHFGTAFLNSYNTTPSVISMVEDIAHQCGHTLFYTLTHDSNRHLKVPKDTPIKNFTGRDYESRDVFGAFHGNFTFTAIFNCFDKLMESDILRGDDKLELLGRIGIGLKKFGLGIKDFEDTNSLLTDEGKIFQEYFIQSFEYVRDKYWKDVSHFNYSNQPYSFNFEKFKEIN